MSTRGPFIVIEGLDRSGKSTQTSVLLARLKAAGRPVELFKFPDCVLNKLPSAGIDRTTPIGQMIDAYLRSQSDLDDRAIHLLFSANRWELASTIENHLNAGTAVVCDRYAFSGIAFSASKGLPFEWCRSPEISLPAPDLTIFLDITPEVAKLRGGYGQERYEEEEMQLRVREIFRRIGQEIIENSGHWVAIDAGREKETVAEDVWSIVEPLTKSVDIHVQRLWQEKILL